MDGATASAKGIADAQASSESQRRPGRKPAPATATARGRTEIRKVSKKRAKENRVRARQTKEALTANPYCQIKSPVCTRFAEHLHEVLKRSAGGAITAGEKATRQNQVFIGSCDRCNGYIEDHFEWALEQGFVRSRFDANS